MSFFGNAVSIKDGFNLDAFGRLRVASPNSLFEAQQEYGLSSLIWDTASSGGGSSLVHNSNTKMLTITAGTGATDYAVLQSRQYSRYVPGKGQLIFITGVFSPGAIANNTVRVGYFDSANGCFLSITNGVASFTLRTSTSGSVSDSNTFTQSNWNIDKFDGTGPSGITVDFTKTQILFIQAQWLGVGRVTVGFDIDGIIYPAHQFLTANNLVVPYTQTFNLPIRMESRNSAGTAGASTVYFNCCSVQSEGGEVETGLAAAVSNGIATVGVTTRRAVLSIRPKATFNTFTNRGQIDLSGLELSASTNSAYWELIYNATLGGAPSWTSVGANSITEYDVAGTTITGGTVLAAGYVISGSGAARGGAQRITSSRNPLTISKIDGGAVTQNTLTIACTSFTGTSNVSAALNWFERYL
jgi:hypothetical protein